MSTWELCYRRNNHSAFFYFKKDVFVSLSISDLTFFKKHHGLCEMTWLFKQNFLSAFWSQQLCRALKPTILQTHFFQTQISMLEMELFSQCDCISQIRGKFEDWSALHNKLKHLKHLYNINDDPWTFFFSTVDFWGLDDYPFSIFLCSNISGKWFGSRLGKHHGRCHPDCGVVDFSRRKLWWFNSC